LSEPLFAGVEAGGTKFVCVVGRGPDAILLEERVPTTGPDETLSRVIDVLAEAERRHGRCAALGLAAFGPLDLDPVSPTFGHLTRTTKAGWSGVDLVGPLRRALGLPLAIDTDVDGAALAESLWGAGRGTRSLLYVTVGTGIGGGLVHEGRPLLGASHAEMGHIRVPRHPADRSFAGVCSFHGDCVEGLASGPAGLARWGTPLETLGEDHECWDLLGFYLAQLAATATLMLAPERIVIGGGVGSCAPLHRAIHAWLPRLLGGYAAPALTSPVESYVVQAELGPRAGALGALALAERLLDGR